MNAREKGRSFLYLSTYFESTAVVHQQCSSAAAAQQQLQHRFEGAWKKSREQEEVTRFRDNNHVNVCDLTLGGSRKGHIGSLHVVAQTRSIIAVSLDYRSVYTEYRE